MCMKGASGGHDVAGAAEVLRSLKKGLPPGSRLHYDCETRPDGTTKESLDWEEPEARKASRGHAWLAAVSAFTSLASAVSERFG